MPLEPLRRGASERPALPERQDSEIRRNGAGLARNQEGFEGLDRGLRGNGLRRFGGFGSYGVSGEGVRIGGHCAEERAGIVID